MKHIIIIAIIALSIASCKSKTEDPKSVALAYLNAFNKADYEGAKQYATTETQGFIEMYATLGSTIPDSVKAKVSKIKIEIKGEPVITGDDALLKYQESDAPDLMDINLKKVNGKWLVNQSKPNPGGAVNTPTDEVETPSSNPDEAVEDMKTTRKDSLVK